jgi:hypothetical protein
VSVPVSDRFSAARAIADAVLYEGYVLYPYRASSAKNQLRWQFGVLTPRSFSDADGSERWAVRTECLIDPDSTPMLAIRVRCLQVQDRCLEVAVAAATAGADGAFVPVHRLEVGGQVYLEWEEAVDRIVDLPPVPVAALRATGHETDFRFAAGSDSELIRDRDGILAGRIVRRRDQIDGRIRLRTEEPDEGGPLIKVMVTVENTTEWAGTSPRRHVVMTRSLVAVHTMLAVDGGRFVSLLDPPERWRRAVGGCRNDGTFPVLIGSDDVVLSSPIILYDHPAVAAESPGDLYDATEIDEILALRVLTLTTDEKAEARATDPRAAAIIDRCDAMPPETWEQLHGAVRPFPPAVGPGCTEAAISDPPPDAGSGLAPPAGPDPQPNREAGPESNGDAGPAPDGADVEPIHWWDPEADASVDPWSHAVTVDEVEVSKGSPVRLWPSRRSDAQDLFLRGLTATVAGVFQDVDGSEQIAVTIDDDPVSTELVWQGRYLFFYPDEVEPLPHRKGP